MIGQLLYFQIVPPNESFHDGQTSLIEGVHRMQTIWKLGHHQIGFTLYREKYRMVTGSRNGMSQATANTEGVIACFKPV